jgi:hypothetical protein
MNMVSLLGLGVIGSYTFFPTSLVSEDGTFGSTWTWVGAILAIAFLAAIVWGVLQSKKETPGLTED